MKLVCTEVQGALFFRKPDEPEDWVAIVYAGGVANLKLNGRTSLKPLEVVDVLGGVVQAAMEFQREKTVRMTMGTLT